MGVGRQWPAEQACAIHDLEVASDQAGTNGLRATGIDVYRKTPDGSVLIYELKVGKASPLNLYQLKMYWDGLVLEGEQPKEATLLVEDFSNAIEEMANLMNTLPTPKKTKPYNFKLEKHKDKGL